MKQVHIVADLGNSYLKSKIIGQKAPVHAIPHAIKFVEGGTWKQEAEAAKRGSRQSDRDKTQVFYMRGKGAIVGNRAFTANYTAPTVGEGKYSKDYFRFLMASQLLYHFPHGHDNIHIHIAHPPNAIPYLRDLMSSVGGVYKVTLPDGNKVTFKVPNVSSWDEPSGSMYTFLGQNEEIQRYNENNLNDGDTIFVCDFGGRISSMTTVEVSRDASGRYRLIPYFDDDSLSITFEGGAQTIMQSLATEIRSFHPELVQTIAKSLNSNYRVLESVFRSGGMLSLRGKNYDVRPAFIHAISPFLDNVKANYETRGITARMVAVTGGSSQPLWDYLVNDEDKILDHANVLPVCPLDRIRFANILGAEMAIQEDLYGKQKER